MKNKVIKMNEMHNINRLDREIIYLDKFHTNNGLLVRYQYEIFSGAAPMYWHAMMYNRLARIFKSDKWRSQKIRFSYEPWPDLTDCDETW